MALDKRQLAHSASTFNGGFHSGYCFVASANSRSTVYGSFAFTMPLATRTPWVSSFKATDTSSPRLMPAPQRITASELTLRTRRIVFVTTSGWAFETAMPVPMSSGGSIEIMSGLRYATAALIGGLLVHTHDTRFFSLVSLITAS